ncbi:MAG: hypothetical protein J5640_04950 [Bacteroidales bacterium]|nr:hypothetical protein [Bacteroidales bacterium]
MKKALGYFLLVLVLVCASLPLQGQKRIYTKGYKMQDFKSKTTKVVLDAGLLGRSVRQEVTSLWTISPYEFCTPSQYEKQKTNPDYYFLHTETIRGIIYLTLEKGGKPDDSNDLKKPFNVVSVPITGEQDQSGRVHIYMPAFISAIQDYADAAMNSETAAYTGVKAICKGVPRGVTVVKDPDEADEAFTERFPKTAVQIIVTPTGDPSDKPRYHFTFGTEDYRLYSFR